MWVNAYTCTQVNPPVFAFGLAAPSAPNAGDSSTYLELICQTNNLALYADSRGGVGKGFGAGACARPAPGADLRSDPS